MSNKRTRRQVVMNQKAQLNSVKPTQPKRSKKFAGRSQENGRDYHALGAKYRI